MKDPDRQQCEMCRAPLQLSVGVDALYCPRCNEWREPKCGEPSCGFCASRPEKPQAP